MPKRAAKDKKVLAAPEVSDEEEEIEATESTQGPLSRDTLKTVQVNQNKYAFCNYALYIHKL